MSENDVTEQVSGDFNALLQKAENGDAEAQFKLCLWYNSSYGWDGSEDEVKADPEQGLLWLKRSAEGGYAPAQRELGYVYLYGLWGDSLPQDEALGLQWLDKAAENDVDCAYSLGLIYLFPHTRVGDSGKPVHIKQDVAKGINLIMRAAARNETEEDHEAQRLLSILNSRKYEELDRFTDSQEDVEGVRQR
ncbi:MAG: sel1 repeat family protein [Dysgonamonadaceae bacterium]|nr:sel1 repeat family protein [Dysgonamonadaceae bacterium]